MKSRMSTYIDPPLAGWPDEAACPLPAQGQDRLLATSVGDAACEQDPTALS